MPSDRCGYTWLAPYTLPSGKERHSKEECYRKIGHKGEHRSLGRVTAPNHLEQKKGTDGR